MADIASITLPNNSSYDLKDAAGRLLIPTQASVNEYGLVTYKNSANSSLFQLQLPSPNHHIVFLNDDGTVDQVASTLDYNTACANLTNRYTSDYLDVFWGTSRFLCKCSEITSVQGGDLKFIGLSEYNARQRYMVFTLSPQNVLTTTSIVTFEDVTQKTQDIVSNYTSETMYPSAKAVYNQFQRKPVTIWEVDGTVVTTGLVSIESDLTDSVNWQLTNLDMTPYKRVKIYTKAGRKSSGVGVDASNTPAVVLEMSLDSRAASPVGGHFCASVVGQKPNDANRMFTVTCAISSDKTSFAVLRMSSLYGTAATGNSDVNGYVWKIEGYYD